MQCPEKSLPPVGEQDWVVQGTQMPPQPSDPVFFLPSINDKYWFQKSLFIFRMSEEVFAAWLNSFYHFPSDSAHRDWPQIRTATGSAPSSLLTYAVALGNPTLILRMSLTSSWAPSLLPFSNSWGKSLYQNEKNKKESHELDAILDYKLSSRPAWST